MDNQLSWLADRAKGHLIESAETQRKVVEDSVQDILRGAILIGDRFTSGGKALLCGNGGSAADCQHMAAELVCRLSKDFERPGLRAIALTTDTSFLTAYANDYSFEGVFERQVLTLGSEGDVLIGISTSGGSINVIRAVEAAKTLRMRVVTLTGIGGPLAGIADVGISVPSTSTPIIQESHVVIEHVLCDLVERYVYGKSSREDRTE